MSCSQHSIGLQERDNVLSKLVTEKSQIAGQSLEHSLTNKIFTCLLEDLAPQAGWNAQQIGTFDQVHFNQTRKRVLPNLEDWKAILGTRSARIRKLFACKTKSRELYGQTYSEQLK